MDHTSKAECEELLTGESLDSEGVESISPNRMASFASTLARL